MNKDELDPMPGNLKRHEVRSTDEVTHLMLENDRLVRDLRRMYERSDSERRLVEALRAENERLRTLLEQTTVMKNEE